MTTSAPVSAAAADKASRALSRVRTRVYDSFLRRAGAGTLLAELIQAADRPDEPSPWVWAVNYCDLGGPLDERRRELLARFPAVPGVVWVPLIGAPYSLLRFPSPASAVQAVLDQRALNDQPSALGPAKPLFLELARPSAVAPRLPAVPGDFAAEGAVELAPGKRVWPCGVEVWYEFVSADDERALIQRMREVGEWSAGAEKRLSVHFGPHFDYTTNATKDQVNPIPAWASALLASLPYQDPALPADQMTGQLYPGGSGIPPHVDTHSPFGDVIWGVSLGSTVTMELKQCGEVEARRMREPKRSLSADPNAPTPPMSSRAQTPPSERTELVLVDLPPRSLLVLKGPARYAYTHGIRPKRADAVGAFGETLRPREDRYSLTFRTVVRDAADRVCACEWPRWCDSRF